MMGLVPQWIGVNFNIRLIFQKEDQGGTAEKNLIAEVQLSVEEDPSAGPT
jgi:hypothetical protein